MVVRNWARNVTFAATELASPVTVAELQDLVASLDAVRALGTGHSFNRIADTDGVLVSTRALDVPIDIGDGTVTVGGGVRFGELAVALQDAGRALPNLGSLPHISVAGACATGTHGSGSANQCLAAGAVGVEFVAADGSQAQLAQGDDGFPGAVLALGALGVVTRMTLETVPTYDLRQDVWLDASLPAVLDGLEEVLDAGYSVNLFTGLRRPGVVDQIWVKESPDEKALDGAKFGAHPATAATHPVAGQEANSATPQLGTTGPWYERLPHFRLGFTPSSGREQQSEYLVPRAAGAAAFAAVARLDLGDALQVCEVRSIAADDLWLSPCSGRDTVGLHFTWIDDDTSVGRAVHALEAALAPFDPRPHWGKVFAADPTWHRAALPAFRELVERYDPSHKFGNEFLRRHVYSRVVT